MSLETPEKIRDLQRKLYFKAKREPKYRVYPLADKVWREDILQHAYLLVPANGVAPGIDGKTFQFIETAKGKELPSASDTPSLYFEGRWEQEAIRDTDYRVRVAQMAVKLVIEPIFEVDFEDCSYGFRPKRDQPYSLSGL